jgi:hypothetical protein
MSLALGQVLRSDHLNNILRALKEATSVISGLAVEPTSPASMNVTVKSGVAVIQGSVVSLASDTTVAISTPDPNYPRFDLITLKSTGAIGYYTGTAEAPVAIDTTKPETYVKPKPPTTPAGELALAEVFVPAGATAIDKIIDRRIITTSMATQQVTLAPLTADPTLIAGRMWFRSDLGRIRYSPDGVNVISIDPPLTAADVWNYSTRTLTQTQFPFWSAIIQQSAGSVSVAALGAGSVTIRPPAGETWLLWIDNFFFDKTANDKAVYYDYDGTNIRYHRWFWTLGSYGDAQPHFGLLKVLTNSLYGVLYWYNASVAAMSGYYGYCGFKLSQPLYMPKRLGDLPDKPLKRPKTASLPSAISGLEKYAWDILGVDPAKPDDYALGIVLEEDTPLAVDPRTGQPVELYSAYVKADVLADFIAKFKTGKADPVATGYSKYLKRWKTEGIDFGIPGI